MARGLLYTLLSLYPKSIRAKAARARRIRPVLPSKATELRYRFALNQVVAQCRRAGDDVAAGMRAHWSLATGDSIQGRDAPPPPPPGGPLPAPGLSTLIEQAARRFGGIEHQAETMARLAARRVLADVDEKLAANLVRSVGVDISSYLAPTEEIGAAMREAATANVELIKSIPSEYLDRVKDAVEKSWSTGQRWESLASEVKHIGQITERRARIIARDQTSKMNAAFNEVRQASVGIEEYDWSGVLDRRERPSHRAMEGTRQRWDSPPLVDGEHVHPGEAILCFPGDSEIQFAHDVKKAYRRWYHGELTEIVTDSGKTLRGTPNHPVLTTRGWLPLGQLDERDHVIEVSEKPFQASEVYEQNRVPLIADIFQAASEGCVIHPLGLAVQDFHGDGSDGQVDVVFPARPLFVDVVTASAERSDQFGLSESPDASLGKGCLALAFLRVANAARSVVSRFGQGLSLFWRQATHSQLVCLAGSSALNTGFPQTLSNGVSVGAEPTRNGQFALSSQVGGDDLGDVEFRAVMARAASAEIGLHAHGAQAMGQRVLADADDLGGHAEGLPFRHQASRVLKARRFNWAGHVFNLETSAGWYVTNGIVAHNCRCAAIPRVNFSELAPSAAAEQREVA